jgi:membrane protease YdiL (CAAX protease family)
LTAVPAAPPTDPPVRWGLPDAAAGFVAAVVLSGVIGSLVLLAGGWDSTDDAPMWAVALLQLPLWAGFGGGLLVASYKRGQRSFRADFGLRVEPRDVPIGLLLGVAVQYVVNYAISWPIVKLTGSSFDDYEKPARDLADKAKASSWWGIVLFVVVVAIAAPIIEELFYRGLVQRSFLRLMAPPAAVVLTAVLFGASHFEALQLAALVAFGMLVGWLAYRTGRLGLSIFTHIGFNATTVVVLLLDKARA